MTAQHRSIVARKIAAAGSRATIKDHRAVEAGETAALILDEYFRIKIKPAPLRRRILEKSRFFATSLCGGWYHFRRADGDVLVAFDDRLIAASVDAALGRPFKEENAHAPTSVERSIAAALARRLAAGVMALATARAGDELHLVAVRDAPADFKIDKSADAFEVFDQIGCPIGANARVDFLVAIATTAAPTLKSASAPAMTWNAALAAIARRAPVSLRAELGSIETTVEAALALAPGHILPLSRSVPGIVRIRTNDGAATIGRFRLGSHEGVRAVKAV
ncbi:MAG: FliM/FliN family flagellar motor switch protein [Parvularculaceae bacterium]|nr:FliM/FliN family flagellar motor switch protein [Parvularculaceae bacterium]